MKKIMIIDGMSCGHCINHVTRALEELDGVLKVDVDLQGKSAILELKKDLGDGVLQEAVEDAGYDVVEIKTL